MDVAVVPRWEWRTFGESFPSVTAAVRAKAHDRAVTRETYILSSASDANVKIRHGQLDIKRLQRVERGLELWAPVLKAVFPVPASVMSSVFGHWAIAPPPLTRAEYTLDHLLGEMVPAAAQLLAVEVAKERNRATVEGCAVEVATLQVRGRTVQTVAVEMKDPDQVLRAVRALGLSDRENVNYVTALKQMVKVQAP